MGGIKSITCNNIAIEIWESAIKNKFWISAPHIPEKIIQLLMSNPEF